LGVGQGRNRGIFLLILGKQEEMVIKHRTTKEKKRESLQPRSVRRKRKQGDYFLNQSTSYSNKRKLDNTLKLLPAPHMHQT